MYKLLILLFLIPTQFLYGFELRVEYSPDNPRAGESFQVYFIATSEQGENLEDIEFNPIGAEVLSKDTKSTSTRTTYINGKLSSYTTQTISYDLFADQNAKQVTLSNIILSGDGKRKKYDDIEVQLLSPKTTKDFFVKAVVSNKDLYVGQGVELSYYLYSRTNVSNLEIKKFPVLKDTLKRFKKQRFTSSRVNYNGQIYDRTQIYSTVIFPEKSGEVAIDPITISARFSQSGRSRDENISFFGFNLGRSSRSIRKVLKSPVAKLLVKPLPKPIPSNFSGLVGDHVFDLKFNKTRFLANEPVEVNLSVEGYGELEAFEAPIIFNESIFEKFDSDGKLSLGDLVKARKDFSYTYLAKTAGRYPIRNLKLSTFDIKNKKYVEHTLRIPAISVAASDVSKSGGKAIGVNGNIGFDDSDGMNGNNTGHLSEGLNEKLKKKASFFQMTGIVGPYFQLNSLSNNWLRIVLMTLVIIIIFLLLLILKNSKISNNKTPYDLLVKRLESKKWKYYDLYQFLELLRDQNGQDKSLNEIIQNSELSLDAKSFYQKVVGIVAQKEYSQDEVKGLPKLKSKYLKEVVDNISKLNKESQKVDEFELF